MKILCAIILLILDVGLLAEEPIPVREPKIGESRPSWWLSLWMNHVVVIEGTIDWKKDRPPEIQISADPKVLAATIGDKDTELFESNRKFRIARIKPKRLLFASPGITSENLIIAALAEGKMRDLQFLLPIMEVGGSEVTFNAENGKSGVYILRYGSMMVTTPLVFDEPIPDDGLDSANAVFKHRNRFDHRNLKKQLGEQVGAPNP